MKNTDEKYYKKETPLLKLISKLSPEHSPLYFFETFQEYEEDIVDNRHWMDIWLLSSKDKDSEDDLALQSLASNSNLQCCYNAKK